MGSTNGWSLDCGFTSSLEWKSLCHDLGLKHFVSTRCQDRGCRTEDHFQSLVPVFVACPCGWHLVFRIDAGEVSRFECCGLPGPMELRNPRS